MENAISCGISCNLDTDLIAASIPLFQEEKVQAIEWSFDTLYKVKTVPSWFENLVQEYSKSNGLIGHGVYFSLFSGKWLTEQEDWLKALKIKCEKFHFSHITEHFGFMSGSSFHNGAPLPVPFTKEVCDIGKDRLMRIQDVCQCPVGVENLALALNADDVKKQGQFLGDLIVPINGFIILDLHNIYCQLHNFNLEIDTILSCYDLNSVREIHISGGSWKPSEVNPSKYIRRDTHDNAVPNEVFKLLSYVISYCPNLRYVILEQLGRGLVTNESKKQFQLDFYKMTEIMKQVDKVVDDQLNSFSPTRKNRLTDKPLESMSLYAQQLELSEILESSVDVESARVKFSNSKQLNLSNWQVECWRDDMLETAIKIARKWKDGF